MRESSSQIIVFLATGKIRDTILKVDEIKIYLEIAKNQKWLAPLNFDLLKNAYSLLADSLARREPKREEREVKIFATPLPKEKKEIKERFIFEEAGIRLEKIIGYFNKNKEAKVTDLIGFLGAISERTVRNDLSVLINKNFIKRSGSRKNARYFLISG
jgi:Fic family protein